MRHGEPSSGATLLCTISPPTPRVQINNRTTDLLVGDETWSYPKLLLIHCGQQRLFDRFTAHCKCVSYTILMYV